MRGFTKAAALLSLARASTFVIPELSTPPTDPVLEHRKSWGVEGSAVRPEDELIWVEPRNGPIHFNIDLDDADTRSTVLPSVLTGFISPLIRFSLLLSRSKEPPKLVERAIYY